MNEKQPCSFCGTPTDILYAAGDGHEKGEPLCVECIQEVYDSLAPTRKRAEQQEKAHRKPHYQGLGNNDSRVNKEKAT